MTGRKLKEKDKKIVASSQGWKCKKCNNLLPASYQIDHIVPHCISKDDSYENLVALCPNCHANKTQKENERIIKFKKMRGILGYYICWFCLEKIENENKNKNNKHNCNKELINIVFENNTKENMISSLDCYYRINNDNIVSKMEKLQLDTVLRIRLEEDYIFVNNFFTPYINYTIDDIANAVFISTRTKADSQRYTEVEIDIQIESNDIDSMIDLIDSELHDKLTQRIFKKNTDIEYTYITL